jgi:hypothetical protein
MTLGRVVIPRLSPMHSAVAVGSTSTSTSTSASASVSPPRVGSFATLHPRSTLVLARARKENAFEQISNLFLHTSPGREDQ